MPATVTLVTTTLEAPVDRGATQIRVASTSGLYPGTRLYIADGDHGELVRVVSLGVDPWVNVIRGVDGTASSQHPSSVTIYIGRADQFYSTDPVGAPPGAIMISPYINVSNGFLWFAQGDVLPEGNSNRWWQKQTTTRGIGPMGVRTTTFDPTEST